MTFVREAMNPVGVTVGTGHTMREAARRMADGRTGAAVVIDPELPAPGIVTERDVLHCVAAGGDLDTELVGAHLTAQVVYAAPDWPLSIAMRSTSMLCSGDDVSVSAKRRFHISMARARSPRIA